MVLAFSRALTLLTERLLARPVAWYFDYHRFYSLNAYLLGPEYLEMVALRRLEPHSSQRLRHAPGARKPQEKSNKKDSSRS
jgi:hypothetical protein